MKQAEAKDNKLIITTPQNVTFELVPYIQTPDGPQSFMVPDGHLDRIAACVNDLAPVPTEVIKKGFVATMMSTMQMSREAIVNAKKAIEVIYGEKARTQKNEDTHPVPVTDTEQ